MGLKIVWNDITNMRVDAIVNSANWRPVVGRGVDFAIYQSAGIAELLKEREKIGELQYGDAAVTSAGKLIEKNVKYIIHTVPKYYSEDDEDVIPILKRCYRNSLKLVLELGCEDVAFPVIGAGVYGIPKKDALKIAIFELQGFLIDNRNLNISLVLYDEEIYNLACRIYTDIEVYIDGEYVTRNRMWEYGLWGKGNEYIKLLEQLNKDKAGEDDFSHWYLKTFERNAIMEGKRGLDIELIPQTLNAIFEKDNEEFRSKLMDIISRKGLKDSEVYTRSRMSKQLFQKFKNYTKEYVPEKRTILMLCVGLNLNFEEARDLLESAGYSFRKNSPIDQIIEWVFKRENYISAPENMKFQYLNEILNYYLLRERYCKFHKMSFAKIEVMDYKSLYDLEIRIREICEEKKKEAFSGKEDVYVEIPPLGRISVRREIDCIREFDKTAKKILLEEINTGL